MSDLKSSLHKFGDFCIEFKRSDNRKSVINEMNIYTQDKMFLYGVKFDFHAAKALYRYMTSIGNTTDCFYYDFPSFNPNNICRLSVSQVTPFEVHLIFEFQNINDVYNHHYIRMTFEEYKDFVFNFFFILLIDLVNEPGEE